MYWCVCVYLCVFFCTRKYAINQPQCQNSAREQQQRVLSTWPMSFRWRGVLTSTSTSTHTLESGALRSNIVSQFFYDSFCLKNGIERPPAQSLSLGVEVCRERKVVAPGRRWLTHPVVPTRRWARNCWYHRQFHLVIVNPAFYTIFGERV